MRDLQNDIRTAEFRIMIIKVQEFLEKETKILNNNYDDLPPFRFEANLFLYPVL